MTITSSHGAAGRHGDRTIGLWLFVTAACFYLLCTSGHINTPDGVIMFRVTQSIVERGDLSIPPLTGWPDFGGAAATRRSDGSPAFYAKYGIGLSLAAIPTYAIGRLLVPFLDQQQLELFQLPDAEKARLEAFAHDGTIAASPGDDFRWLWYDPGASGSREGFLAFCAGWTNSLVVACIVLGVFLIGREIGYSRGLALAIAALAGVATPLWAYAKDYFSEPLAALALTYFFYFALRARASGRARSWWAVAGLSLGLAGLAKPALIVLVAPAIVLLAGYTRKLRWPHIAGSVLSFALGVGGMVAVTFLYNYARFGSVIETGYGSEAGQWTTPFLAGFLGLLASPGRGLLIYFPLWVLLLPSAPLFTTRRRMEFAFIVLSLGTLLALHSKWHQWEGGVCWGPRFLIPAVPLLVLPLGSFLALWRTRRDVRIAGWLVVAVSTAIAFSGTWVNYFEYSNWVKWQALTNAKDFARGVTNPYQLLVFDFRYAPIGAYWTFPRKDYYFLAEAIRHPGFILGIYGVFAIGLLVGAILLRRAITSNRDHQAVKGATPGPGLHAAA